MHTCALLVLVRICFTFCALCVCRFYTCVVQTSCFPGLLRAVRCSIRCEIFLLCVHRRVLCMGSLHSFWLRCIFCCLASRGFCFCTRVVFGRFAFVLGCVCVCPHSLLHLALSVYCDRSHWLDIPSIGLHRCVVLIVGLRIHVFSPFHFSPCRRSPFQLSPFHFSPFHPFTPSRFHPLPFHLSPFCPFYPFTFRVSPFTFHPSPFHLSPFTFHPSLFTVHL